jgi:transposase
MVALMWGPAEKLSMTPEQERTLQTWVRAQNTPQSVVARCRIVLMAADGLSNNQIAKQLGISRPTVILWRDRFLHTGPPGLTEIEKGRGRKPSITPDKVQRIIDATLHSKPKGATHWSCRTMAKHCGASAATVQRIWDAHGLQPHRVKKFKLSRDPQFVEKLTDVVGLYVNPPDKALVVCVDEKSQIQALDRTQPGLPMKKGRCGTMTHDYKRHGTTTLFAALNVLEGTVIADCMPRHRNQEFLAFLRRLDREFPASLDLHLILDNYGTHKHPNVTQWLAKRPRFHLHFIPTSSSWLNLIERWFAKLTDKQIRRGIFHSVPELIRAIRNYVEANNQDPVPFVWTASVQAIMEKINRCKAIYATQH